MGIKGGIKRGIIQRGSGGGGASPSGLPSLLSQSSVWVSGINTAPDYYTVPNVNYPNSDWAEILLVKLNYAISTATQHIFGSGQFGTGTSTSVALYLNGVNLNARIRDGGAKTYTPTGSPVTPSLARNLGWYIVCVRRVGSNYEIAQCALNGAAVTTVSTADAANALVPNGTNVHIGTRNDATSSNGQSCALTKNNIAWYARVNGTITNAQLESLATGLDIMTDLGLSPLCYIKFNSIGATITDSSGTGNTATKVNSPALRGAPAISGMPVTISQIVNAASTLIISSYVNNWYGQVFQRLPSQVAGAIIAYGTYSGNPGNITVRVINKSGTQVAVPVLATYPSAGLWKATLTVPQGGEYTLEAYYSSDSTKIARSQVPWGVGIVLLVSGESIADQQANGSAWADSGFAPNLDNTSIMQMKDTWAVSTAYTTSNYVTDTTDNTIYKCATNHTSGAGTMAADRLANPTYWTQQLISATQVDTLNGTVGVIMHVIARLYAQLSIPCMAAFGAKTGSCLYSASPTNWNTYSYDPMHGKIKSAIANYGSDMEAFLWVQGANDANNASPPTAAQYATALQALIPQILTYLTLRTAATCPTFIPILGRNSTGSSAVDAGWRAVRSGDKTAIAALTNCFDGSAMHDLAHVDNLHPSTAGYVELGKREAQAMLNYYAPLSYPTAVAGANVLGAAVNVANNIDVQFTLPTGATTLQGLTGATGLTGWVFTDGASPQTPTLTGIPSADTVRFTFVGLPGAGWTVDYIPTQNPTVTNLLYDNRSVVSDTVGVPVRAFDAAITL